MAHNTFTHYYLSATSKRTHGSFFSSDVIHHEDLACAYDNFLMPSKHSYNGKVCKVVEMHKGGQDWRITTMIDREDNMFKVYAVGIKTIHTVRDYK